MGLVAIEGMLSEGSPILHSKGENQKWPTSWPNGHIAIAVWGGSKLHSG